MASSFLTAVSAVFPFLIYLGIGFLITHSGMEDVSFMNRLNKITFRIIFPFLMFDNIYKANHGEMPSLRLMVLSVAAILILIVTLMIIVPRIVHENPKRGVIIQAVYRSNFMLYGLPLTLNVFGSSYAGRAGIMVMIVVAVFNVTAVIVLETFHDRNNIRFTALLLKLVKNPLLQGCALGLLFFLARIRLPSFLEAPVSALSSMASPLALITLGGSLQFQAMKKNRRYLIPVLALKLMILPAVMLGIGYWSGLRGPELFLFLMIFATPVGASSYPMAVNMGGDGELAGQFVFLSTVISLPTVFMFIFFMAQFKMLAG